MSENNPHHESLAEKAEHIREKLNEGLPQKLDSHSLGLLFSSLIISPSLLLAPA
jgi:hypothetical protein